MLANAETRNLVYINSTVSITINDAISEIFIIIIIVRKYKQISKSRPFREWIFEYNIAPILFLYG